ncbi:MAG: tryptophan-rich sensory protein [Candidatus Pacebacteria bacterium]|nr:tryptophan-rich sensory protein [Candidatus Paceibacterota bacterium]
MNIKPFKILIAAVFLIMVMVNFLADVLPINGITTGDVSDSYPNLFAPAGITFSIWGIIYLLLIAYVISLFNSNNNEKLLDKIGIYFILSSVANILWIFCWHYDFIGLSVILIVFILISLIKINDTLNEEDLSKRDKLFVKTPFSVYFGWITIAVIANITTFLVSVNWNGFGLSEEKWTIIILLVGAIIGILRTIKDNSLPYGLVLLWAYSGILLKHFSQNNFAGQYPDIIFTIMVCILFFLITMGYIILKRKEIKS